MNHDMTVDDFDLADKAIQADPYPYYPLLREQKPVFRTAFAGQPCWVLSRRKDIAAVLMDPKTYSSRTAPVANMLFADPPEHERLRLMVAARFTRPAVANMAEGIRGTATTRFETCRTAGRFDAIVDFASPLAVHMMGQLLGIPVEMVTDIRARTHLLADFVMALRLGKPPSPAAKAANEGIEAFFLDLIDTRGYAEEGIMAVLAECYRSGDLTSNEVVRFVTLLFGAGHTTTTNLIGNTLYVLSQRPADLARLKVDPAFVEPFIEEVLRMRPSFHRILRITTREVEIDGEAIPAGSIVRLLLASANRDPAFFPDGEVFDADRKARMHSAFGQGIHSCLGSWLARLEGQTALRVVSAMTDRLELDPSVAPVPLTGGTFNEFGFEHLPMTVGFA